MATLIDQWCVNRQWWK